MVVSLLVLVLMGGCLNSVPLPGGGVDSEYVTDVSVENSDSGGHISVSLRPNVTDTITTVALVDADGNMVGLVPANETVGIRSATSITAGYAIELRREDQTVVERVSLSNQVVS